MVDVIDRKHLMLKEERMIVLTGQEKVGKGICLNSTNSIAFLVRE